MKRLLLSLILSAAVLGSYAQDKPFAKQCTALTTKNVQCRNRAEAGKDYCKLHDKDAPRCGVITSKGQPCKRRVSKPGLKCWNHSVEKS